VSENPGLTDFREEKPYKPILILPPRRISDVLGDVLGDCFRIEVVSG
jgi:hypothetical protein